MKKFYQEKVEDIFEELKTDENGLSTLETEERLKLHGENALEALKDLTVSKTQVKRDGVRINNY